MKTVRDRVRDVVVVGGGPAGWSAAFFLARAGLDVLVVDAGESPLGGVTRVANFPGCPEPLPGKRLLERLAGQAAAAGAVVRQGYAVDLRDQGGVFELVFRQGDGVYGERLLLATGADLRLAAILGLDRSGNHVATDFRGRTSYPRVYAAGLLRGLTPEHAAVSAGDGAWVALNLVSDLRGEPYYDHGE